MDILLNKKLRQVLRKRETAKKDFLRICTNTKDKYIIHNFYKTYREAHDNVFKVMFKNQPELKQSNVKILKEKKEPEQHDESRKAG